MSQILFVNACVRGEESRTLGLARCFLDGYLARHPGDTVAQRNLMEERLQPWYPESLFASEALKAAKRFDQPMFDVAREFVAADKIVIAAPFWDLSFPAILKIYLERVSVVDLTFGYDETGKSQGYCKADRLLFVTTRGGCFTTDRAWMEHGASLIKGLCAMYGIPSFQLLCAEGIDDARNDSRAILDAALAQADDLAAVF